MYIGVEGRRAGFYQALPFYAGSEDPARAYDPDAAPAPGDLLKAFAPGQVKRELGLGTDEWRAGDLQFRVFTRVEPLPDPDAAGKAALRRAYVPALVAELEVDNRGHGQDRTAFVGFKGGQADCAMRVMEGRGGLRGVAQGRSRGFFARGSDVRVSQAFTMEKILERAGSPEPRCYGIGLVGALLFRVPARQRVVFRLALCVYREGKATSGMDASYYYTGLFSGLEGVADYALEHAVELAAAGRKADRELADSVLNPAQRWQLAHAVHSYHGSTQLLKVGRRPLWVVNEGAYRMMNTFDLTVDQVFFESRLHPWTVRNVLDWYVRRYACRDRVRMPDSGRLFPGGLSFTHDMGVANVFSPKGRSSYEQPGLKGCFSYMTHEELVNWVLCALVYLRHTGDRACARRWRPVLEACLESMANRDHDRDAERTGLMSRDSALCAGGEEITTYDSLDPSLGRARGSLYLGVKCWAAYLGLERELRALGSSHAALAGRQALRASATLAACRRPDGRLPALAGDALDSWVLPVVEGLAFVHELRLDRALDPQGPHGPLVRALREHARKALRPGRCLFPDGGIQLSSTSRNSWLSKIYLCQFVLRRLLRVGSRSLHRRADEAHRAWLLHPSQSEWAWSDQMMEGVACGSKYYPRGVTAVLWLEESGPGLAGKAGKKNRGKES